MDIQGNKEMFLNRVKTVQRPGIEKLINFLSESDFFTAPASTDYHSSFEGGLCHHSLRVDEVLWGKNAFYNLNLDKDTCHICGLLHDVCKANFYTREMKAFKVGLRENGKPIWEDREVWVVDDHNPLGHGEKSVMLLQNFIPLTKFEALAIRWHMGLSDITEWGKKSFNKALELSPGIMALHCADIESSYLIETRKEATENNATC
jgi:hypothetical protein